MSRDEKIKLSILKVLREDRELSMSLKVLFEKLSEEIMLLAECEVASALNDLLVDGIVVETPDGTVSLFNAVQID